MKRDDIDRLVFLVSGIYINLKRNIEAHLKPHNLTFSQFGVLSVAASGQGMSQTRIADALDTDTTNVMVIIDSLEKKRYVEREKDTKDRRVKLIRLTERGTRELGQASTAVNTYRDELAKELSAKQLSDAIPPLEETYLFLKRTGNKK